MAQISEFENERSSSPAFQALNSETTEETQGSSSESILEQQQPQQQPQLTVGNTVRIHNDAKLLRSTCEHTPGLGWLDGMGAVAGLLAHVVAQNVVANNLVVGVHVIETGEYFWFPQSMLQEVHNSAANQNKEEGGGAAAAAETTSTSTSPLTSRPQKPAGLGVVLNQQKSHGPITVSEILPGGAADECGLLRIGDEIVEVDGKNVANTTPLNVRRMVVGPEGSSVVLGIIRRGDAGQVEFSARLRRQSAGMAAQKEGNDKQVNDILVLKMQKQLELQQQKQKEMQEERERQKRAAAAAAEENHDGESEEQTNPHLQSRVRGIDIIVTRPTNSDGEFLASEGFGFNLALWTVNDLDGDLKMGERREDLLRLLLFAKGGGIVIRKVVPGSPADKAGILKWDVIRVVNGQDVRKESVNYITSMVKKANVLKLSIVRDENILTRAESILKGNEDGMDNASWMEWSTSQISATIDWMGQKMKRAEGYNFVEENVAPFGLNADQSETHPKCSIVPISINRGTETDLGLEACCWTTKELSADFGGWHYRTLFGFANERGGGVPIFRVIPGKPADAAGVRKWDVIIEVNGFDVRTVDVFQVQSLFARSTGKTISLKVLRDENIAARDEELKRTIPTVDPSVMSAWGLFDSWKVQPDEDNGWLQSIKDGISTMDVKARFSNITSSSLFSFKK